MGRRRRDRNQLLAGMSETLGGLGKLQAKQRTAGGEHQVKAGRYGRLMAAIDFAQATLGAVAMHGIAHGSPRSNHAHTGIGRRVGGPNAPSEKEDATVNAAALLSDSAEVGVAPQALTGGQSHGWARGVRHAGD